MKVDSEWKNIRVSAYCGYKDNERPLAFWWQNRRMVVAKILSAWKEPNYDGFKIIADDGNPYLLRWERISDQWQLKKIRTGR